MRKPKVKESGELSYGPKSSHDFIPMKEYKGKGTKDTLQQKTTYFSCFVIYSTTPRHDNKHHLSTIWRFFYNFSYVI